MDFSFLPYSIVNDVENPSDYEAPYSFLTFMQYESYQSFDLDKNFKNYQNYIFKWSSKKNIKKSEEREIVRDAYVNLLREITLNFATEEEKRFILNSDFTDDSDLDIIIPFFIQKLKQISFYYKSKRKDVKDSILKYNLKGSNVGVESVIKKIIFEYIENNVDTKGSKLSSFYNNFDINVEELYGKNDTFYDKSENTKYTYTNDLDYNIFLNFKESIINAISAYPLYLKSSDNDYISDFTFNPILSGNELYYLKNRDFINYISSDVNDSLKLNLFKKLYPKFIGTDFYYISTNSENKSVSGLLFESKKIGSEFLNKHFSTNILNQPLDKLYSLYELGGFFIPQNQTLLVYNTPDKTYTLNSSNTSPDKIYVFPDPNEIGNATYASDVENNNSPLVYTVNVDWNRTKISNGFRFNDVLSNNYDKLFYGYQSRQQNTKISTEGVSKVTDNITFWGGDKDQIWQGSFDVDVYPIDKDTKNLLLDEGVVVDWYTDEYSNEFGLYKNINTQTKYISGNEDDGGLIKGSSTDFSNKKIENSSIYEKKNTKVGKIFVRNNFYNTVSDINTAFSKIFFKYPDYVIDEINDKVLKLFVINNVIVIETENYVISDSYKYDIENNEFQNASTKPFYNKKIGFNKFLDTFVNPWYDEKNKKIFLVFLKTLENSLSASNYKYIFPEIYASSLENLNYSKIYPNNKTLTNIYSLSGQYGDIPEINLVEYSGGSFRKNSFLNEYNFSYFSRNLNSIPFIVNEKLYYKPENNTFVSEGPLLLKPFYYFLDNNYANPSVSYYVRAISNKSGYIGVRDEDSLNLVDTLPYSVNYAFASNVETLEINQVGKYVVHFDWESYSDTNIFVGDEFLNIKEVENNLLVMYTNKDTQSTKTTYLTSYNETKNVFNFFVDDIEFYVNITRPTYPYDEVVFIEVDSTQNIKFSGFFSDNLSGTYRRLKIQKTGSGKGDVFTDPPCIYCGDNCEYLYSTNSTINLVASAASNSRFVSWLGDTECGGTTNDCVLYLDNDKTLIANFELLPLVTLKADSTLGSLMTLDGQLNCSGTCATDYFLGTYVTISASPAPFGYRFNKFDGIPCYRGDRVCTFIMWGDVDVKSLYREVIYYDFNLGVESEPFDNDSLIINTEGGEFDTLAFPTTKSILVNQAAQGIIEWVYDDSELNTTTSNTYKSLSEQTFISLTAKASNEYYEFNKWIGGPCNNSNNPKCNFDLDDNYNIVAYFNYLGYTVTVTYSAGGGVGRVYSTEPIGLDCEPFNPSSLNVCSYEFLSGKKVTIKADNTFGDSTFIALCADDPNIKGIANQNTLTFVITGNVSLTAVYLPFGQVELWINKFGPNKVLIESTPEPNAFGNSGVLYLDTTTTQESGLYIKHSNVDVTSQKINGSNVLYYDSNVPLQYTYIAGNGISMGSSSVDVVAGSNAFILLDQSVIITNNTLGAPYAQSNLYQNATGVKIEYSNVDNLTLTQTVYLSAFLDYKNTF
jgi:hypothetical protein